MLGYEWEDGGVGGVTGSVERHQGGVGGSSSTRSMPLKPWDGPVLSHIVGPYTEFSLYTELPLLTGEKVGKPFTTSI